MRALRHILSRKPASRLALIVQIDNMAALRSRLGTVQCTALVELISSKIGALLEIPPPSVSGPEAQIAATFSVRGERALRQKAAGLRAIVRAVYGSPSTIQPQFRAVLLRGQSVHTDTSLLETARRHLFAAVGTEDVVFNMFPKEPGVSGKLQAEMVEPYFQPQLCCHTGEVSGFDLLPRYLDPVRETATPISLQSLDAGERSQLTRTMLGRGLEALAYWAKAGFIVDTVTLHTLASDLAEPHFVEFVSWELDRQDIPPNRLIIALADEVLQRGTTAAVRETLLRLSRLGCKIDLTGFGTGFASLEALRHLPINRVRIDRCFVADCDNDPRQQRMILAILALAERVDVSVLADGVQRPAQHAFLGQIGCSHVQGPALAAPMPLSETLHFLVSRRTQNSELPVIKRRA